MAIRPKLHPATVQVLSEMYSADRLQGTENPEPIDFHKAARVKIRQGSQINQIMRSRGAHKSMEIGFAYGFSTVWMLDALNGQDQALHVAIDPFEKTQLGGIGLYQTARLPYSVKFEWIEDYSIHALSGLIKQKAKFDFIFIDGNHRVDDALMDFYLSDQLLAPWVIIAFDDVCARCPYRR